MRFRLSLVCSVVFLLSVSGALHAGVRYTITLSDPARHLVQVSMQIPSGRESHELQLPVWNALYQVRDFAQYLNDIRASGPAGPLPLTQLNKSRWRLDNALQGATVEYEMFANDPGSYGAELNNEHAFFNLAELLLYADGTRNEAEEVEFHAVPQGWAIATSLTQQNGLYKAPSYDALVDAPVEIGKFKEKDFAGDCGRYRVIVDAANAGAILEKITPQIMRIVNSATAWMNDCPFESYTFIFHFGEVPGGGGMEHAYSTAISLPRTDAEGDLDAFTSVTAHEFFHLWNVKRIRPQSLEPVDYTRENYTKALWFSEGVDTTAADSIRRRAGILDVAHYLDKLSQSITELENRPAHLTQSVEQASLDAWLEKYPYYGVRDRSISYYNKGELLGVLLDLKIRQATAGKQSLQTLFRWLNEHYAKQGRFFADSEGIREAVEQLTGMKWRDFFDDYVAGLRELPWNSVFAYVGLQVTAVSVDFPHRGFEAVQPFDRSPVVVEVEPGGEAEQAGLRRDDEIISVNGATAARKFEQQIEAAGPGSLLRLRIRRNGAPLDLQWKLGTRRVKIYRIAELPNITVAQKEARSQWLYGSSRPTQ